ncbi:hypothetical protein EDD37DRAFT_264283 [Exophiala viscosa]|uniref:uncharacterized protein n=1 Tax=Exophiala viscosa TaxID=2486360 RepID=UPI0021907C84|nr:hypothetical protein EDD37DRAFT_264283 [Exophiala viscosa]
MLAVWPETAKEKKRCHNIMEESSLELLNLPLYSLFRHKDFLLVIASMLAVQLTRNRSNSGQQHGLIQTFRNTGRYIPSGERCCGMQCSRRFDQLKRILRQRQARVHCSSTKVEHPCGAADNKEWRTLKELVQGATINIADDKKIIEARS